MTRAPACACLIVAAAISGCHRATEPEVTDVVKLDVPTDPTVAASVSFAVGSQDDPPGKEGLAYLTGQMLADAATQANSLEVILEKLYPLAASYQIRVDKERTTLTGRTHRDNVAPYFELFSAAYLQPAFDESDFKRIKSDAINHITNTLRYSSDEELAKAALDDFVFRGTPYAHPPEGTVQGLQSVTLEDVRNFYDAHFTTANALLGVGGSLDDATVDTLERSLEALPKHAPTPPPAIDVTPIHGRQVLLISKPGADASISFGVPLDVRRGERDFYALWIANSWLGEHRSSASHLYQVIREARGLNYGDYSYIEAFPEGGYREVPPVNVPRRRQLFEIWIRTLPNDKAVFALRAALRELAALVDHGLTEEQFELRRDFLKKYSLHFAETTAAQLGYAIDDRFYGLTKEGNLAKFRRMMDELTLEDVNSAIKRHLQYANLKIAIVTGDADGLRQTLASGAPTPITYDTPKSDEILAEDKQIAAFPLEVSADAITVVPVAAAFER